MATETRELTCIGCPLGCRLSVAVAGGAVVSVAGNSCPHGDAYARTEVLDPRRTVTTTVRVRGSATLRMLPVKTAEPVPKGLVRDVVRSLAGVTAQAPVAIGDAVLEDVCGTGIAVVATADAR